MKPAPHRPLSFLAAGLVCVTALTGLTGCDTPGDTALLGAATGAAIGAATTGSSRGTIQGAAIGAGAGYVAGKIVQHERRREAAYNNYPVGEPTRRYGFVVSPYEPHNLVDVRGIPSGARVIDPSVDRIFINP